MIDTIKIYTEIDKTIYDKIRCNSVIKTSYNKKDGEVYYEIINDHLEGSYSSNLSVRVDYTKKYNLYDYKYCYIIEVEGSYHKFSKGYNSHNGYYDLKFIVSEFIKKISFEYNINLPSLEFWYLQRCDIAICFDLENQNNVRTYINNLSACKYPRRNLKFYQDESVYVSGTSSTLKIYNKLLEFRKHDIKKFLNTDFNLVNYMDNIKGFIRFECEIKKKKLKDFYKKENNLKVIDVKYEDLRSIWVGEFMKLLKFVDSDLKVVRDREEVYKRLISKFKPVKARNLYNFFVAIQYDGIDTLKQRVSESTYYRNLKELKECKIDISQKFEIVEYNNIIDFCPFTFKEVV